MITKFGSANEENSELLKLKNKEAMLRNTDGGTTNVMTLIPA